MISNSKQRLWFVPNSRILLAACVWTTLATGMAAGQSASACGDALQLQALASELRSLRIELLQDKIERAQSRIAELEQQLQRAEADRNQANSYERSQAQELAELQERLSQPALDQEERAELEAYRTQLMSSGGALSAARVAAAAKHETDVREELDGARRRRIQLVEALRALGGKPPRT